MSYFVSLHHKNKKRAMKIYTSYFGNNRKLKEAGVKIICVAIGRPRFISGVPQMVNVAPTRYMISAACSHDEYLRLYDEILANQDAYKVIEQIESLSEGKDVALCCYEKPGDFCHRHILAKWLTENTGIKITEFGVVEKKEPKYEQASLF
ncbi:DUF488 family protein, N3 subclade [Bacteroides caccae]|jgi:hypothetical protein|uniref:DUF488 domain-containing protein n=2 Tax=root TaxID=1 RepID=A0A8S5N747_9CAUD|nr:DUF488 family protein [Bacteroides caccae]DAD90605.1 MAG TPA: protein of unknown function DUF488 [Siphoviridae sp. ctJe739]DAK96368.1 MAG TPA: protein of unknown function DUF488 [Caudoviricetes sp.]ASM66399.1 DUF488 domain-containing protein [Bacteroides caccae]EDM22768.1 hypothetical protein BACCAC_01161 [Bacteroides caccae ATCC 43185]MDC7280942.1 DUF488 domain-containing protein [Bacteroides caccae]